MSRVNRATAAQSLSVSLTVGAYGVAFGAASVAAGFTVWQSCLLSLLTFTGASQFAVVGVLGRRPSEVGGYPLFEMLFQQAGQRREAKECVDNGNNFRKEVPYLMSDGTAKMLEISVAPTLETSGGDVAYVSIVRDVTERSGEQTALRVSHDQLTEDLNNLLTTLPSTSTSKPSIIKLKSMLISLILFLLTSILLYHSEHYLHLHLYNYPSPSIFLPLISYGT